MLAKAARKVAAAAVRVFLDRPFWRMETSARRATRSHSNCDKPCAVLPPAATLCHKVGQCLLHVEPPLRVMLTHVAGFCSGLLQRKRRAVLFFEIRQRDQSPAFAAGFKIGFPRAVFYYLAIRASWI